MIKNCRIIPRRIRSLCVGLKVEPNARGRSSRVTSFTGNLSRSILHDVTIELMILMKISTPLEIELFSSLRIYESFNHNRMKIWNNSLGTKSCMNTLIITGFEIIRNILFGKSLTFFFNLDTKSLYNGAIKGKQSGHGTTKFPVENRARALTRHLSFGISSSIRHRITIYKSCETWPNERSIPFLSQRSLDSLQNPRPIRGVKFSLNRFTPH